MPIAPPPLAARVAMPESTTASGDATTSSAACMKEGCCGCCSLRVCCTVHGALTLALAVCGLGGVGLAACKLSTFIGDPLDPDGRRHVRLLVLSSIALVVLVGTAIVAALFLVGIWRARPAYLRCYIAALYLHVVLAALEMIAVFGGLLRATLFALFLVHGAFAFLGVLCAGTLRGGMTGATQSELADQAKAGIGGTSGGTVSKLPYTVL